MLGPALAVGLRVSLALWACWPLGTPPQKLVGAVVVAETKECVVCVLEERDALPLPYRLRW